VLEHRVEDQQQLAHAGDERHLLGLAGGDQALLATFIRYRRPLAARIWTPASRKHRQLAPGLLREALERLQGSEAA
jgi:hypothetical protein